MLSDSFKERIAVIDGLRAILCFMVLQEHLTGSYNKVFHTTYLEQFPFYFLYDGKAAVSGFFVLSGYVLSLHCKAPGMSVKEFGQYVLRRVLRIYPAYWATLLVTFLVLILCYKFNHHELLFVAPELLTFSSSWTIYFNQFFLLIPGTADPLVLPQSWSLFFEMSCSILLPLLLLGFRKNKIVFIVLFLVALKLNFYWYSFHFLLGAMLVEYQYALKKLWISMPAVAKYLLLATAVYLFTGNKHLGNTFARLEGTSLQPLIQYEYELAQLLNGVGFALILLIVLHSTKGVGILSGKLITKIGRCSYSIFLIHPLIITVFLYLYGLTEITYTNLITVLSFYGWVYLGSYVVSYWMWRKIELPAMRIKK